MITLNLTPTEEAHIVTVAHQTGLALPTVDDENAAAIAQLRAWRKEEATDDPEEIRRAEADLRELMQALNRNRITPDAKQP